MAEDTKVDVDKLKSEKPSEDSSEKDLEKKKKINIKIILANQNLPLYVLGITSSVVTFLFFYFSNNFFKIEKKVEKEIDIYKVAKEEAIKLGRIEPDEDDKKPIEVGPDGKVIIPSLYYADIGGMGPNSNKSFVSNIKGSNDYLSMEISFSSYKGEKLSNYLKDFDPQFRNIIMKEIDKRNTSDFMGSKNRKRFLEDIKNKMNEFLLKKEEDPIIFSANLKTFVINQD